MVLTAIMEFYKPEIAAWDLYPDTMETLVALRDDGLKMGLISNAKSDWAVRAILEKHDLSKFFGVILTSAALRIRKPRLDIFWRALYGTGRQARHNCLRRRFLASGRNRC